MRSAAAKHLRVNRRGNTADGFVVRGFRRRGPGNRTDFLTPATSTTPVTVNTTRFLDPNATMPAVLAAGGSIDSTMIKSLVPVGATLSYRLGLGTGHGLSIYGSPIWESIGRGGGASTTSVFRGALGLDVGITSALGATIGVELGQSGAAGSGKPSRTAFGAAVSYVIGAGR